MSVDRLYLHLPCETRDKHERIAAIRRAAIKAAVLPPRQPVTSPAMRRSKSRSK